MLLPKPVFNLCLIYLLSLDPCFWDKEDKNIKGGGEGAAVKAKKEDGGETLQEEGNRNKGKENKSKREKATRSPINHRQNIWPEKKSDVQKRRRGHYVRRRVLGGPRVLPWMLTLLHHTHARRAAPCVCSMNYVSLKKEERKKVNHLVL